MSLLIYSVLLHKFNFLLVILEHLYASTFSVHDGLQKWLDIEWTDLYTCTIKGTTGDG